MPNRLDIPPELSSLIEKRDGVERRQKQEESASREPQGEIEERRSGEDRRQNPQDHT